MGSDAGVRRRAGRKSASTNVLTIPSVFLAARNFGVVLKDRIEKGNSLNPGASGPAAKGTSRSFGVGESKQIWQR
jgi:hypothetical protein